MDRHTRTISRRSLLLGAAATLAAGTIAHRSAGAQPGGVAEALLDGVLLPADDAAFVNSLLPIAVMIDNFPDARPQSGMDAADLVYELLVEGGITRFMPVFLRQEAEWVEPVRSARTPFLYLARELGAVLGHVGAAGTAGPTDAQTQFGQWGVLHLDEQFNPEPFWRDRRRVAPHNACTSTIELRGHALGLGWAGPSGVQPWRFKDDFFDANPSAGAIESFAYGFNWGSGAVADFSATWQYDASSNLYLRSQGGYAHRDGITGARLTATNVVAQYDTARIVNNEGHVLYGSLGYGPAYIFQDGQVIEATWTKRTREERTRYWDAAGVEVHFNRGRTWVAVLPEGSPLDW